VAQEVLLRAVRNLKPNKKPSRSYVFTIASNLLKDRFHYRRVREADAHFSADEEILVSSVATPEQLLEAKQLYLLFKDAIKAAKPNSRRAFVLYRIKGYTQGEVARKMGISKSMVKKHIYCVMLQLRKKLCEYI